MVALGGSAITLAVLAAHAIVSPPSTDQIVLLVGATPFYVYLTFRDILIVRLGSTTDAPTVNLLKDLSHVAILPTALLVPAGVVGIWCFSIAVGGSLWSRRPSENPLGTRVLLATLGAQGSAIVAASVALIGTSVLGTGADLARPIAGVCIAVALHFLLWCAWMPIMWWAIHKPAGSFVDTTELPLLPLVAVVCSLLLLSYDPRNPEGVLIAVAICVVLHESIRHSFLKLIELPQSVRERDELRRMAMGAAEVERRRVAYELHETALQSAYVAKMAAERLHGGEATAELFGRTAEDLRQVMRGSLPLAHVPGPLSAAVEAESRHVLNGSSTDLNLAVEADDADVDRELLLFIVREAVRNAAKHASADTVDVSIRTRERRLDVRIADDGVGFDTDKLADAHARGHFGLDWLRQWVEVSGGSVMIESAPGSGTTIAATLPSSR